MTTTTLVRRTAAALASGGLAAALALIPGGAHAQVKGEFIAVGSADADYVGSTSGGTCTLTSGDDDPATTPVVFGHGTKHKSVNLNATFSSSDSSSDQVTVKGHLSSSLTLKKSHNDLKSFDLQAGGAISVSHTTVGSHCRGTGELAAEIEDALFTEHHKGTLTVTRSAKKHNSLAELVLFNVKNDQIVTVELVEGPGSSQGVGKVTLKPGQYVIEETFVGFTTPGSGIGFKAGSLTSKTAVTNDLRGVFTPAKKHHH